MSLTCTIYLCSTLTKAKWRKFTITEQDFDTDKLTTFALWKIEGTNGYNYKKMAEDLLQNWEKKSADHQKEYKKYLHRADKNKVLKALPALHDEAVEKIDCLQCANCCKNYSPRFKAPDIKRIAKYLQIKEGDLINTYLYVDGEGDYVLKSRPCPFLGADNFCSIYEARPSDCRRFPYTDEDVLLKRQPLTLKNSSFCPIVYYVLEKLMLEK